MAGSFLMRRMAPGFANGIGVGLWLKLLAQNRFRIAPSYLGRAAVITGLSALNSLGGLVEQAALRPVDRAGDRGSAALRTGSRRSGTTHLHNLLSQDPRFGYANTFQAMNPRIFLLTQAWLARLAAGVLADAPHGQRALEHGDAGRRRICHHGIERALAAGRVDVSRQLRTLRSLDQFIVGYGQRP